MNESDRVIIKATVSNNPIAQALFKAGEQAQMAGNGADAKERYAAALKIDPAHVGSLSNLAAVLADTRRYDAALITAKRAIELDPNNGHLISNVGNILWRMQRYDEAEPLLLRARELVPESFGVHHNLGLLYYATGRPEQAIRCYTQSFRINPAARGRGDLAFALLAAGHYPEGFLGNETRWNRDLHQHPVMKSGIPEWRGQPLKGKTIIVHHEQGYGDIIMFARFVPMLKLLGAKFVYLIVPGPLFRFLDYATLADLTLDDSMQIPKADYRVAMMSLPLHLKLGVDDVMLDDFIAPWPHGLIEKKSDKLAIGLCWHARRTGHEVADQKSIPFTKLLRLAELPHVQLFSLQKGPGSEHIVEAGASHLVTDLEPQIGDFADLAGLAAQMDIVISICSAPAHCVASIGKPTWIMLPYLRSWAWTIGRDCPWYSTMRYFQQPRPGDWGNVVESLMDALERKMDADERAA